MAERFTIAGAFVYSTRAVPARRFDEAKAQVAGVAATRRQNRFTINRAQMMGGLPANTNNRDFTLACIQVMSHWTPDFSWIENSEEQPNVFVYEEFPYDISFGSISATTYATDVVLVDSGDDQRVARWNEPLQSFDISYGVRTMEQLQGLMAFFRAMKGRLYGFLYKDPIDYMSTQAFTFDARSPPAITATDQVIGTGDDLTYQFQIIKTYTTPGGNTAVRTITKPNAQTVQVALNGTVYSYWTVDPTMGIITFTSPLTLNELPHLTLTVVDNTHVTIEGSGNCFSALGVGTRIIMTGWANAANNTTVAQLCKITAMPDNNTITVKVPNTVGANESNRAGVAIQEHPAPASGVTVTAGYEFWVPVRFDTDKLPMTLNDYGIGDANAVTLQEIRSNEAI